MAKMPLRSGFLASAALTIAAAFAGSSSSYSCPTYVSPSRLGAVLEALAAGVGGRDTGLDVDDEDLALAADELPECGGSCLAAGLVVGGDLRHRHVGLIERGVDEHDLRAVLRQLLDRREHRLRVGRRHEHRVGLLGRDRVDDGGLQRRRSLVGALEVEGDPELLGLGLGAAVHRDVELVALDARDERHLVVLLGFVVFLCPSWRACCWYLLLSLLPHAATASDEDRGTYCCEQVLRAIGGTDLLLLGGVTVTAGPATGGATGRGRRRR